MRDIETVPCKVCGEPTNMLADRRCTNCWEVEARLKRYLKSQKGQEFAEALLAELKPESPFPEIEQNIPLTKDHALALVQTLQNELFDLYRDGDLNLQDKDPQAFYAGLLAWESVRLFWYALRGDNVGVGEKHSYVTQALKQFERMARD